MFKALEQIAHEMKRANDIKEEELYLRRTEPWLFAGSHHGYPAVSYTHLTLPTTPYV